MAETDRIEICSEALVLIGEQPITTLEGQSVAQLVANARYRRVAEALMAVHPWDFNRRVTALAAVPAAAATAQVLGWDRGYQMPTDAWWIEVPTVSNHPVDEWEIAEGILFVGAGESEQVALRHHGYVDEQLWHPLFRDAVVYQLSAEFAVPMTEDGQRAAFMAQEAEKKLSKAKHQNANRQPTYPIRTGRFAARRLA